MYHSVHYCKYIASFPGFLFSFVCNHIYLTEISSVVCNIDDSYYVCSIVTKQEKRKPGNEAAVCIYSNVHYEYMHWKPAIYLGKQ